MTHVSHRIAGLTAGAIVRIPTNHAREQHRIAKLSDLERTLVTIHALYAARIAVAAHQAHIVAVVGVEASGAVAEEGVALEPCPRAQRVAEARARGHAGVRTEVAFLTVLAIVVVQALDATIGDCS